MYPSVCSPCPGKSPPSPAVVRGVIMSVRGSRRAISSPAPPAPKPFVCHVCKARFSTPIYEKKNRQTDRQTDGQTSKTNKRSCHTSSVRTYLHMRIILRVGARSRPPVGSVPLRFRSQHEAPSPVHHRFATTDFRAGRMRPPSARTWLLY